MIRLSPPAQEARPVTRVCLLITEQFEPTADFLLAELRRRDVPCIRWNLDRFPLGSSLTYRIADGHFAAEIFTDGRKVNLDRIGSIWCRGFRPLGLPNGMSDDDSTFVRDEAQRALRCNLQNT